jgi:chitodextrinase
VPDTDIEWRARFMDNFGEWSEWSAWVQVHISTAGIVTLDEDPFGTIQEVSPDFYGRWSHTSLEAMTKIKVRILEASTNRVLYTSGEITKAAASSALPGTLFEVTWASTGFSDLAWGRTYKYQMSGKDTSGVWSDWSNRRQFKTNQPPRVPSSLNPRSSQVYGAYPLLTCRASDNDDTVATGLEVHAEIVRPDLSLVDVAMTYNATTAQWEFQTTGTQVTAKDIFSNYSSCV